MVQASNGFVFGVTYDRSILLLRKQGRRKEEERKKKSSFEEQAANSKWEQAANSKSSFEMERSLDGNNKKQQQDGSGSQVDMRKYI